MFPVEKMCEVFKVSTSAFYDWKAGRSTKRIEREARIKAEVQLIWGPVDIHTVVQEFGKNLKSLKITIRCLDL